MSRLPSRALHPVVFGIAIATLAAACSEAPTTPSRSIAPQSASLTQSPELNDEPGNGHIMHTKGWFESQASNDAKKASTGGGSPIKYHGGSVLRSATNVAAVYWSSGTIYTGAPAPGTNGSGSSDTSLVGFFLSHLGGSSYFNINSTYYDASRAKIANVVNYTQYWANNTNAPSGSQVVTDADMVAMLQSGFDTGALTYDPSTLYIIMTAGAVNLGGGFGTQYCAYHTHGFVTANGTQTVLYAAMPYTFAYPSACTSGFPAANGGTDRGADYEVNVLAHEIEETTTDDLGNAWFDSRGFENADKCAWTWGTTYTTSFGGTANINVGGKDFLVQRNWLATGGCALLF